MSKVENVQSSQKILTEGDSLKDLVVLDFASNACYVEVLDVVPKGLTIDLAKQEWFQSGDVSRSRAIGDTRYIGAPRCGGVIGVYRRDNMKHLSMMANATIEATRDDNDWD